MKTEFIDLCNQVMEASMYWTGEDEEKNRRLKKIRTLAGFYLAEYQRPYGIEKAVIDYLSDPQL